MRTGAVDSVLRRRWPERPADFAGQPYRLAVLGSSTTVHLPPSLRVAGLRAGLWLEVYEGDYGQYRQELNNPASSLHAFRPDAILFAVNAWSVSAAVSASDSAASAPILETQGG